MTENKKSTSGWGGKRPGAGQKESCRSALIEERYL
jgi:hypothetical protein